MKRIAQAVGTLLGALVLAAPLAVAEVSVDFPAGGGVVPFFQPGSGGPWERVRPGPSANLLNEQGDSSGDGWPCLASSVGNGDVDVVWSSGGDGRDILHSWHDGSAWHEPVNLSGDGATNELPALATDDSGNRFVAWQAIHGSHHVVLFSSSRGDTGDQVATSELSQRSRDGLAPALAVHVDERIYVAYELRMNGVSMPSVAIDQVTVMREPSGVVAYGGANTIDLARKAVLQTDRTSGAVEARVHAELGHLWVTWIHDDDEVGWSELEGDAFTVPEYVGYTDSDEPARAEIREIVLGL